MGLNFIVLLKTKKSLLYRKRKDYNALEWKGVAIDKIVS